MVAPNKTYLIFFNLFLLGFNCVTFIVNSYDLSWFTIPLAMLIFALASYISELD